ncbi:MAG: hypothetical protein PHV23_03650 [Candidatus Gracilibacteria bacterium]|nr:hypothetical protein [Candidatus Gracilibacteria bacterium]
MPLDKDKLTDGLDIAQDNEIIGATISSTKKNIDSRLNILNHVYDLLKDIEKSEKGFRFRQDTMEAIFRKYPNMSLSQFKSFFLGNVYNKNILMNNPEIIDYLDLENVKPGEDLISIVIDGISMSKEEFDEKVKGKFDILTFPNLSSTDVAQGYFFSKLKTFLPDTQIIFGDMPEIRKNLGVNQFNSDSVGFIDLLGNGLFNTCLFKLFKTEPDPKKIEILNDFFSGLDKNIFIGGSTYSIPFEVPSDLEKISMPKMLENDKPLKLQKGILLNAMGYLNSAYYTDKVRGSYVLGSHNIAEPMHAGKLTVISNDLENRYNHNWLISYFGEKTGLLLYMYGKNNDQQNIDDFLGLSKEDLDIKYKSFQKIYEEKIKTLIYGIFYNFLLKNFPDKFN